MKQVLLKDETESMLETYLAITGQTDLSQIVDQALRTYLFEHMVEAIKENNKQYSSSDIAKDLEEALNS
jgi:Ribbon-helix-helix domain